MRAGRRRPHLSLASLSADELPRPHLGHPQEGRDGLLFVMLTQEPFATRKRRRAASAGKEGEALYRADAARRPLNMLDVVVQVVVGRLRREGWGATSER